MVFATGDVTELQVVEVCQDVEAVDTTLRYDLAKAQLRRAKARGEETSDATEEFIAAREALRGVLEMMWPGR